MQAVWRVLDDLHSQGFYSVTVMDGNLLGVGGIVNGKWLSLSASEIYEVIVAGENAIADLPSTHGAHVVYSNLELGAPCRRPGIGRGIEVSISPQRPQLHCCTADSGECVLIPRCATNQFSASVVMMMSSDRYATRSFRFTPPCTCPVLLG